MKIRILPAASRDLERVLGQSKSLFGPMQAKRYSDEIRDAILKLSNEVFLFPERLEFTPPIRVKPYKAHLILYRVEAETVFVLRVRHGREDWRDA